MKKFLPLILLVAVCAGGWYAYSHRPVVAPNTTDLPASKFVTRAEKRDIDATIEVSGDVTPAFQLDVKSEVGGKLKVLNVEPGDTVKQGDVLVEVDDRDLLSEKESALTEIEGANLSMEKAKKNFDRSQELFDAKLISREVFDNLSSEYALAQNGLTKAERKLQLVEDKLRKTKVACADGWHHPHDPGDRRPVIIAAASVNSGTTLMTVANLSKLLVETHINQVDVARSNRTRR